MQKKAKYYYEENDKNEKPKNTQDGCFETCLTIRTPSFFGTLALVSFL